MRKGEMAGVYQTRDIDEFEISRLMVGRGVRSGRRREPVKPGEAVISFEDVIVERRRQKRPVLNRVSFSVHAGEILAFAGVAGNGLGTLEAILGGFLPISSGRILYHGRDISRLNGVRLRRQGLAYVPADRMVYGCAPAATVAENIIINRLRRELRSLHGRFSRWGFLDRKAISRFTGDLIKRYGISGTETMSMGALSGGNIQKVILAREIEQYKDYIVFSEPTWGLDIAASDYVYEQIADLKERGAAVILISSNLDEILANADRILVFYRGTVAAEILNPQESGEGPLNSGQIKEEIGAYMLGIKTQIPEAPAGLAPEGSALGASTPGASAPGGRL
jgi:simple sugar transport system ATP-binding protein